MGDRGAHQSNLPMSRLSQDGYRVIMYDQLGCGNSQQPLNEALYTVERYVEEVEGVRTGLGLDKVHLYGHSWGAGSTRRTPSNTRRTWTVYWSRAALRARPSAPLRCGGSGQSCRRTSRTP